MKRITLLLTLLTCITFGFSQGVIKSKPNFSTAKATKAIEIKKITQTKETVALRKKYEQFLACSPFKKTLQMSEDDRIAHGIPPNKFYEQRWELTMNPETGRPTIENLEVVRKELEDKRKQALLNRTPGDAVNNAWEERGPNNVGGRTRAIMFDPNDTTNETVFAGSVSGGLWKNTNISNASSSWNRVNILDNLTVSCIVADPNNNNIFYVGTGESYTGDAGNGDGVWKSIDAGATWTRILGGISGSIAFYSSAPMVINSPGSVAGSYANYPTQPANFGVSVVTPITANIVLVGDSSGAPTEACSPPLTNPAALNGKIALIRRGNCSFVSKVQAAQDAGAIAAIVMNNIAGTPLPMGGTSTTITIPSLMISQSDGNLIEVAANAGIVNGTINPIIAGAFTGTLVPGIQYINDIKIRNNAGVSEIFVAAGDSYNNGAYIGGPAYGLYKSVDGGTNWSLLTMPLTTSGNRHCPMDIAIGADNKIWVSTTNSNIFGDGGGKVFASSNGGTTFVDKYTVTTGKRTQIAISASVADKLYLLSEIVSNASIETVMVKTTDGFATTSSITLPVDGDQATRFTTYGFTGQQAFYDLMIEVDPQNDQTVYVGGIDLFKSMDGCASWSQISHWQGTYAQYAHSDQHGVAFGKNNSSKVMFGNDGGVYYSGNAGTTITSTNIGYNVTQFYGVAVAPTTSGLVGDYFASGAQDNGTQFFASAAAGVNSSVQSQGGDGGITLFDQGTDKYYISNYVYNDIVNYRSALTGTARLLSDGTSSMGAFIAPMVLDSNKDILYSDFTTGTTYQIRRYINVKSGTVGRVNLTNALLTSQPTAFAVSKYTTASTTLLVGTKGGKLLKIGSANTTTTTPTITPSWTDISVGSNFVGSVSDVEFGASQNEIMVTLGNYNVVSIWYTADGGGTWENKEGNLPDIPVNCILRNPLNVNEAIVGTDLGVWFTNTFTSVSPTWNQSYNGMRNIVVMDMDVRDDNTVFAATYGRGVFSGVFTALPLSTSTFESKYGLKIYPNPSNNGLFNISMNNFSGKLNIQVSDINGRLIYNDKNYDFNSQKTIDLSAFQSGIYILKLNSEDINYSTKLIKN